MENKNRYNQFRDIKILPQPKWTKFERQNEFYNKGLPVDLKDLGVGTDECYANSRYQVWVYRGDSVPHDFGTEMIWLAIKRLDKEPIHDWRDLQRIKNELVGEENEAMELYPKESRLVDECNQFHLWVFADENKYFPVGWKSRKVGGKKSAEKIGGKQRPFDNK